MPSGVPAMSGRACALEVNAQSSTLRFMT